MEFVDTFFRFTSIGVLMAWSVLIIRGGLHVPSLRYGLAAMISIICLLLSITAQGIYATGWIAIPLRMIDMLCGVLIWFFCLALFDDDFRPGRHEFILLAIYLPLRIFNRLNYLGFDVPDSNLFRLLIVAVHIWIPAHLAYVALSGRSEDLVESRRRARIWFTSALAGVMLLVSVIETGLPFWGINPDYWTAYAIAIPALPLSLWGIWWTCRLHPEVLRFEPLPEPVQPKPQVEPRDLAVRDRLIALMQKDKLYREPGLSIGVLASRVGVPEHQLRALINKGLGFRNFSAFLNHYRIEEIKTAFTDPAMARTPVLTIAMDAGFGSLAPFNRAFKQAVGVTPTAFRAAAEAQWA